MKRIALLLALLLLLLTAGCAGAETAADTTTSTDTTEAVETTEFSVTLDPEERSMYAEDFVFSDYLTLGNYRDLAVTVPAMPEITDTYLHDQLTVKMTGAGYFERDDSKTAVAAGDVVNLNFESLIDGEEYSGGSQSGFNVVVGAGGFISAFETALVGRTIGETFEISAAYPDDYDVETLAGKTADFTVTVNYICTVSPLTDEVAAALSGDPAMTADAYLLSLKEQYTTAARVTYETARDEALWNAISEATELRAVPVCDRMDYCQRVIDFYKAYAESIGYTYADFLAAQEYTENSFLAYLYNDVSYDAVSRTLVLCAICDGLGLPRTMSDAEYTEALSDYAVLNGYSSLAAMEADYSRVYLESLAFFNRVMAAVAQTATVSAQ